MQYTNPGSTRAAVPNPLAPGTGFPEDSFSTDWGWGQGKTGGGAQAGARGGRQEVGRREAGDSCTRVWNGEEN